MMTGEAAAAAGPEKHTCKPSIDAASADSFEEDFLGISEAFILHFRVPVLGLITSIEPSLWPIAAVAVVVSDRPFKLPMAMV
jgi:hypothetical protein